ncbi:MAG TPA: cytochrome c oxidase subunit 3 [Myxococcales bacterium]|nr:cytochrome c oxidase subunit 3 [Myxococcales bacterium]
MSTAQQPASVIPYRPRRARADATAWLGMVIFLASWTMLFAALFFAYAMLRVRATQWPPAGTAPLPVLLPAVNTAVLAASSVALQSSLVSARRGRVASVAPAIYVALGLGALFLVLQVVVWVGLWRAGLRPEGSSYGSVFYALTVFHALHVLAGLGGLAWLAMRARTGAYGPGRHVALRLWTGYWHFVGVVWFALFVTLFLI